MQVNIWDKPKKNPKPKHASLRPQTVVSGASLSN